ncbi:hypothetical protein Bbelb_170060 [Branchiostoma belcheri]|nr:hypothetical protein Bbelb_170060 [Branchiostoma belcheri]
MSSRSRWGVRSPDDVMDEIKIVSPSALSIRTTLGSRGVAAEYSTQNQEVPDTCIKHGDCYDPVTALCTYVGKGKPAFSSDLCRVNGKERQYFACSRSPEEVKVACGNLWQAFSGDMR